MKKKKREKKVSKMTEKSYETQTQIVRNLAELAKENGFSFVKVEEIYNIINSILDNLKSMKNKGIVRANDTSAYDSDLEYAALSLTRDYFKFRKDKEFENFGSN